MNKPDQKFEQSDASLYQLRKSLEVCGITINLTNQEIRDFGDKMLKAIDDTIVATFADLEEKASRADAMRADELVEIIVKSLVTGKIMRVMSESMLSSSQDLIRLASIATQIEKVTKQ